MAINLHKPVFNPATGKYVPIDAAQVIDNFDQLAAAIAALQGSADPAVIAALQSSVAGLTTADRIPSRADFDARAAAVRGLTAGAGFLEWGGQNDGWAVSSGMWMPSWGGPSNSLGFGSRYRTDMVSGVPVVHCAGYVIHLDQAFNDAFVATAGAWFASPPNSVDLPARHDLVMLEVWHERVDAKDIVYPCGCVQWKSGAVALADDSSMALSNALVTANYSALGAWDTSAAAGYGAKWSTMTDAQRKLFAADPRNNIYLDHDGAVVQVRWRLRSIAGPGSSWQYVNPMTCDALGYSYSYGANGQVMPRGQIEVNTDFEAYNPNTVFGSNSKKWPALDSAGLWVGQGASTVLTPVLGHRGLCFALPLALVKRERNLGIYHATHNPGGCATATGAAPTSLAECFALPRSGGLIASGVTAHPSGLYADAVYPDDVFDLRMSAHRADPAGVLRKSWASYRSGRLRRVTGGIAAASVSRAARAVGPVVSAQGLEVEPSAYNPATGEVVYPTTYVGAGAVKVPTLVGRSGQAVMQIATDPAADGIVDIDLADGLAVELPYFFAQEG